MSRRPKRLQHKAWDALQSSYAAPESPEWLDFVPKHFWEDEENHKRYINWLARQLKIKSIDDWYQVSAQTIHDNCGGGLIQYYEQSHINLIRELVPNAAGWQVWKFNYVPRNFWTKKQNRVDYLKWLEKELGYTCPDDWYQITSNIMNKHHGKVVDAMATPTEMLRELYPRYDWLPWKFQRVEAGFWDSKSNQKRYLKWLGKQLGFKKRKDWYRLSKRDFYRHHGRNLIDKRFGGVPYYCLRDLSPEYEWLPWLFNKTPEGFWEKKKHRVWYVKWLGEKHGFSKPSDWYQLAEKEFKRNKGSRIYEYYNSKIHAAVSEAFPRRTWHPWLFQQTPKGYFEKKKHREDFYRWFFQQRKIRRVEQIASVELRDIKSCRGTALARLLRLAEIKSEMKKLHKREQR